MGGGTGKPIDYEKLISALIENLAPMFRDEDLSPSFFNGKMETFLTCRALASYFKENILDEERGEILETATLKAILVAIHTEISVTDAELLISELPNIFPLRYPEVKDIFKISLDLISQIKKTINDNIDGHTKFGLWRNFNDYDKLFRLLKAFENYKNA